MDLIGILIALGALAGLIFCGFVLKASIKVARAAKSKEINLSVLVYFFARLYSAIKGFLLGVAVTISAFLYLIYYFDLLGGIP